MPVSMTAITTSLLPTLLSHASAASMSASGVPPVWPVLSRPYSCGKLGSFGVAIALTM